MGKKLFLTVLTAAVLSLTAGACTRTRTPRPGDAPSVSAEKKPLIHTLLEQYMPAAMRDGMVKIAVVVNLAAGDHARQFLEGCVTEGRSLGFAVDSFITGADARRCRQITAGIAASDYDGLVFAYDNDYNQVYGTVNSGSTPVYDLLRPIADAGIPVVSFEVFSGSDNASSDGITATFKNDELLARQSLAVVVSHNRTGTGRPARVVRINAEPEAPSIVRRAKVFDEYKRGGTIVETACINVNDSDNADALPQLPLWTADALWAPHETFAEDCIRLLAASGRKDIKLISIGISNEVLRLMQRYPELWIASAAVDPKLAGIVNTRMLAARLAGEPLPSAFNFAPQLVKAIDLNRATTIANIHLMMPGWDDGRGLFDHYQWMSSLKAAEGKSLR